MDVGDGIEIERMLKRMDQVYRVVLDSKTNLSASVISDEL